MAGLGPERLLNGQQPHVQLASTPPRIVMSQSQAAVPGVPGAPMELSCQVLIDGESKTVSFPMDFATDTPESVAREMVEELGIPETEETIADIVAQIKSVRPAADGAWAKASARARERAEQHLYRWPVAQYEDKNCEWGKAGWRWLSVAGRGWR